MPPGNVSEPVGGSYELNISKESRRIGTKDRVEDDTEAHRNISKESRRVEERANRFGKTYYLVRISLKRVEGCGTPSFS